MPILLTVCNNVSIWYVESVNIVKFVNQLKVQSC